MPILKVFHKEYKDLNSAKHLGVKLPPGLANTLNLYSLANGSSKTKLIISLVEKWEAGIDKEKLITKISDRCLTLWKLKKAKDSGTLIRIFKEELIAELEWKGLSEDTIKSILINFNNGTK